MRARKRPVEVECLKLKVSTGRLIVELFCMGHEIEFFSDGLYIKTLEGTMTANIGDVLIKGVNGELYPCKPDIFEKTYEIVEE